MRSWLALSLALATACGPSSPPSGRRDAGPEDAARPDTGLGWDAGRDAGRDAGPCGALALCGTECVDLATDAAHCGACDAACTAPADGFASCVGAVCDFECDAGFVREGEGCAPAPRPLWPPSLSIARSLRPTLRWLLPSGLTNASVELCADAACASVIETIAATGEEALPSADLPAGLVFWRVTASGRVGPMWRFDVASRAAPSGQPAWGLSPDYDRDGYDDVAIGAPFAAESDGRVAIHRGGPSGTSAGASAVLRGASGAASELGASVACAGDLDGDGYADLAVGSPRAGDAGRVEVFFGGPDAIPESGARSIAIDAPSDGGSLFGSAIAGAGDVDGDGYGDLVVAAAGEGVTPGRFHVYRGRADGVETTPARTVVGSGRFASALAGAGDVDGDGLADLAVGAYAAGSMTGEVQIFLGSASGIGAIASFTIAGVAPTGRFGFSVAWAGDLNGDGFADLAVGAPDTEVSGMPQVGSVLVFYGSPAGPSASPDATLAGVSSGGGFFGHSVAGMGDGDGDGIDELAVGAFGVAERAGRVSVFMGSESGLVTTMRTTVDGPFGAGGDFGWALASAGDVDRNGRDDLVVGAPGVEARSGRAYVFRGAVAGGISTTPLVEMRGAFGGSFGRAVATAGR